jgi:L-erythro-3,5-diaminohexanoate dehydrogenase
VAEALDIIATRGKMQNPVTGSGGMLIGTVDEVGPRSPLGLKVGDRVATLVSLTLTPLAITDALSRWNGQSEQVPARGHAILFARSNAAVPADLVPSHVAVLDVCGAPALTERVVRTRGGGGTCAVIGGAGKSGSLSLAAARRAGARTVGIVPNEGERQRLEQAGIADHVALADARDPVALATAVTGALGGPADVTVVCVDVPGCEHGAILATADGGTVIFFSMATSLGRRAGRGGPGRRRHHAGRQWVSARACRFRPRPAAVGARRTGDVRGPAARRGSAPGHQRRGHDIDAVPRRA